MMKFIFVVTMDDNTEVTSVELEADKEAFEEMWSSIKKFHQLESLDVQTAHNETVAICPRKIKTLKVIHVTEDKPDGITGAL